MQSLQLGHVHIDTPVFLAPMSGVTDVPFRTLVLRHGAGMVVSEMVASREALKQSPKSLERMEQIDGTPHVVQLAGCCPQLMADAARFNQDLGADIIDINFGCPAKKVVGGYAGSALMQCEASAGAIMQAVAKAVDIPVTVKMRLGWDETCLNAPLIARMAQDYGLQMVTVHGRTRSQFYKGHANWAAIAKVVQSVDVPVIVNGDIKDAASARRALAQSGAAGIMVGRGAYGKPWQLARLMKYFKHGVWLDAPKTQDILGILCLHYQDILAFYGPHRGVRIARKHMGWYLAQIPGGQQLRDVLVRQTCGQEVLKHLQAFACGAPVLEAA